MSARGEGARAVAGALLPVRGSWAVMALWAGALLVASLPAAGMLARISAGPARATVFADAEGPLPWPLLVRLLPELVPTWSGLALAGAGLLFASALVLRPGALVVLGAADRGAPVDRPLRATLVEGIRWLWPMLRVALVELALVAIGVGLVGRAFESLAVFGRRSGWSELRLELLLPLARLVLIGLLFALVGALAAMTRVVLVADRRRLVRSAMPIAGRVLRRAPFGALVFPVALHGTVALLGGAALLWWRQHPPASLASANLRGLLLVLLVALQTFAWHWILRAGLRVYALPRFDGMRLRLDRPWSLGRRALRAVRALRRRGAR